MENGIWATIAVFALVIGAIAGYAFVPAEVVTVEKQVVVPQEVVKTVEVPVTDSGITDNDKIQDIYEGTFVDEINFIEDESLSLCYSEFDGDDLEEYLEDSIDGFDKLISYSFDDDWSKVTVLGLDDDEDSEAEAGFDIKVRYTLNEGEATKYKKTLSGVCSVVLEETDFDSNTYKDSDVEFEFA